MQSKIVQYIFFNLNKITYIKILIRFQQNTIRKPIPTDIPPHKQLIKLLHACINSSKTQYRIQINIFFIALCRIMWIVIHIFW